MIIDQPDLMVQFVDRCINSLEFELVNLQIGADLGMKHLLVVK